jgi:hypothetical protein
VSRPWLHAPVGKLHDDRYLPLHPNLVALIDEYRARYVPANHPLLLPRKNGTALDRHTVTRIITRADAGPDLNRSDPRLGLTDPQHHTHLSKCAWTQGKGVLGPFSSGITAGHERGYDDWRGAET